MIFYSSNEIFNREETP